MSTTEALRTLHQLCTQHWKLSTPTQHSVGTQYTCSIQHSAQSIQHSSPALSTQHPALNTQHSAFSTYQPALSISNQHSASSIQCSASSAQRSALILYRALHAAPTEAGFSVRVARPLSVISYGLITTNMNLIILLKLTQFSITWVHNGTMAITLIEVCQANNGDDNPSPPPSFPFWYMVKQFQQQYKTYGTTGFCMSLYSYTF